jgi:hypothetical protein
MGFNSAFKGLSKKENKRNCFICLQPVLLRLKKLPKHTMSTQISCVLFHSRCSTCCRGPNNLLRHLLAKVLSVLGYKDKRAVCYPIFCPFLPVFVLPFFPPVLLRFAFVPFVLYFYSVVVVFCIACLPLSSRYTNSRFHELEETFRSVEVYIQYSPVYLDLLYHTVIQSACKNLFYRPAFALPTAQRRLERALSLVAC